jgi:hypothetical protein
LGEVLDEGQALINLNTPFYYWNIAVHAGILENNKEIKIQDIF